MLPVVSTSVVQSDWSERVRVSTEPLKDYERGGPTLGAASTSASFEWEASYDGESVWVSRDGVEPEAVMQESGVTQIALAFDQSMNPHIAYVSNGVVKWRWWDTLAGQYDIMTIAGARTPRCTSDEKTPELVLNRDIVLTYMKGSDICVRIQRERFGVEHVLTPDAETAAQINGSTGIIALGMNSGRRLQWRFS